MSREEERHEVYRRSVIVFTVLLTLGLAFMIVRPFLVAILSAIVLAYIFYPFYLRLFHFLPKNLPAGKIASMLTCLVMILIILIPAGFVASVLSYEIRSGYLFLQDFLRSPRPFMVDVPPWITSWIKGFPQFEEILPNLAVQVIDFLQGFLKGIPNMLLQVFITIFSTYYFLKHGQDLYNFFSGLIPLPEKRYKQLLSRIDDLCRGMIYGQIAVGFVQGILAWFGFLLLGVPNPVLWGFLTAIISIIPLLGAVLVWFPMVVYLLIQGFMTGAYWRAIVLFFYGVFVISLIDNILKPKIVGEHARIHPLIILFGMLGGISLFGIPGLLIGPFILAIFDVMIEVYKEAL